MKLSTLETVFNALNNAQVRYLVAGGIAVNIHGYQRMTSAKDLDDIEHLKIILEESMNENNDQ